MFNFVRLLAIVLAVLGLGVLISLALRRTTLVKLDPAVGHTILGGTTLAVALASCGLALLMAMIIAFDWGGGRTMSPDWPIGAILAGIFGVVGVAYFWLWARTRWTWDLDGVASVKGKQVTRIKWSEIVSLERISWHSWRVVGAGLHVDWSRYTIGYEVLNEALKQRRPDLTSAG